jgi:hypothetical protein
MTGATIRRHTGRCSDLRAFDLARQLFRLSKMFPKDETYSLIDQMQ